MSDLRPRDYVEHGLIVRGAAALLLDGFLKRYPEEWNAHTARAMSSDSMRRELTSLMLALEAAADWHRGEVDAAAVAADGGNGVMMGDMTTDAAAAELGLKPRRVRQLLEGGVLAGRLDGGRWTVAAASVAAEKARRNAR